MVDVQQGNYQAANNESQKLDADSIAFNSLDISPLDQDTYLTDLLDQVKSLEAKANSTR